MKTRAGEHASLRACARTEKRKKIASSQDRKLDQYRRLLILHFRMFACSISQDVVDFVFSQARMLAGSHVRSVRMLLTLYFRLFACSQDRMFDQSGCC